ncbi:unnamed protein product [Clonostachys rosea f. rosea IK726]|uniref:Alginate lyase domain-containing protein n=2 Tax=Bionectria ochroleuca TaxID=29856 RepID=A0A0B7JQC0_BIOOC|nr:unnamed protein product [Clonostachys rosea f. rosea IK726]
MHGLGMMKTISLLYSIAAAWVVTVYAQVGPLFPVHHNGASEVKFTKTFNYEFKHPGIDFSHDDLERVRQGVLQQQEPWKSAWERFIALPGASANYTMSEVMEEISRGVVTTNRGFERDGWAALYNTIAWYITRDQAHLDKASSIIDAWGTTLKRFTGLDNSLGVHGGMAFINAAEILRSEGDWIEEGESYRGSTGFSGMLYRVMAPAVVSIGQSNYGIAMVQSLMAISIYLEDVVMWNYAMNEYQNNVCGGIKGLINPQTGQSSESGRDQGHVQFGLGIGLHASLIAWNQGHDLFHFENSTLRRGLEYSAKYNANGTVPYDPRYARCNSRLVAGPWPKISEVGRGELSTWWLAAREFYNKVLREHVPSVERLTNLENYSPDPFYELMYSR